jgi:peptidyl-prolyl cis-trans isomerase D
LIGLIGTFAVWGVGDMLRSGSGKAVAVIGDEEISQYEFATILQREVQALQPLFNELIDDKLIERLKLRERALDKLVDAKLAILRLKELGIDVGEDAAADYIQKNDLFLDDNDNFSEGNFKAFLKNNGLTEKKYLQLVRNNISESLLLETITGSLPPFVALREWLFKFYAQRRVVDVVTVPFDWVKDIADPSETDLLQYYQEHPEEFTLEEMRKISYFTFGAEQLKAELEITEDELKAAYQERSYDFTLPEQRNVEQYLFKDEASAKSAYEKIASGQDLDTKAIALGWIQKSDLPSDVQGQVFDLSVNKYSQPISSALGWHLFIVKAVKSESLQPFVEVKETLEASLIEDRMAMEFNDLIGRVEDDIAGGSTIKELSQKYGYKLSETASFDAYGANAEKKMVEGIPAKTVLLPAVFQSESEEPLLLLLPDNQSYAVVSIDQIYPSRVKALDEVKGVAIKKWKEKEQSRLVKAKVSQAVDKAQEAKRLGAIGEGVKYTRKQKASRVQNTERFQIIGERFKVPTGLVHDIFRKEKGEVTDAYMDDAGNYTIAQVRSVIPNELTKDEASALEDKVRSDLEDSFISDTVSAYYSYLRTLYPVEINESLFRSVR